jgi:hypothetical protein
LPSVADSFRGFVLRAGQYVQGLLLGRTRHRRTPLARPFQLSSQCSRRLLGGQLLPAYPLELRPHTGQLGGQPGVARCTAVAHPGEQVMVFIDQAEQLPLDLREERVHLRLLVATPAA